MISDFGKIGSMVSEILVVDAKTEKIIDAKSAHYVLGSKAPGTMTTTSKYAFAKESDANAFQKKMGGKIVSYKAASQSAIDSMKKDVAMTDKKRAKKMYPMGKKIFNKACSKSIDPLEYSKINQLKADIKNNKKCGKLKEKQLQAVALYLWDIKRKETGKEQFISVEEHEKCPVCGMFVYKYPKWAARVEMNLAGKDHHEVFDGVKDMLKFYFNPSKWGKYDGIKINGMQVTDYYSQKAINAHKAFYVIGSDVHGPMGHELIPFITEGDAQVFMKDHQGKQIVIFNEITEEQVYDLD
jgi:nitrous oxide reductase accessory protein NosL